MFNCIYSKSKAANSEVVIIELMKSYCLPSVLYAVEATLLSTANIRVFETCINRSLYKIFGLCDRSSLDYLRECFELDRIKQLTARKHSAFIERLLDNHGLSTPLLMYAQNSIF